MSACSSSGASDVSSDVSLEPSAPGDSDGTLELSSPDPDGWLELASSDTDPPINNQ